MQVNQEFQLIRHWGERGDFFIWLKWVGLQRGSTQPPPTGECGSAGGSVLPHSHTPCPSSCLFHFPSWSQQSGVMELLFLPFDCDCFCFILGAAEAFAVPSSAARVLQWSFAGAWEWTVLLTSLLDFVLAAMFDELLNMGVSTWIPNLSEIECSMEKSTCLKLLMSQEIMTQKNESNLPKMKGESRVLFFILYSQCKGLVVVLLLQKSYISVEKSNFHPVSLIRMSTTQSNFPIADFFFLSLHL